MTKKFLLILVLALSCLYWLNLFQNNLEKFIYARISEPFLGMVFAKKPEKPDLELQVRAAMALKINAKKEEKILFKKNIETLLPIASLTKLMTALISFEDPENYDFSKTITVSGTAAAMENVPEYGNLEQGERKSIGELLNLMLAFSSNDAAQELSEVVGKEEFVDRMNEKTRMLALNNTYFANPTGLDPDNMDFSKETAPFFNHSSVKDLSELSRYILEETPVIYELTLKKQSYQTKNGLSDLVTNQNIIGGKTGYTDEAGGCMIVVLENSKGSYFINIILGAASSESRVQEMQKLIDWLNL